MNQSSLITYTRSTISTNHLQDEKASSRKRQKNNKDQKLS